MKKKWIIPKCAVVLAVCCMLILCAGCTAQKQGLYVNGRQLATEITFRQNPYGEMEAMLPVAETFRRLGFSTEWTEDGCVQIDRDDVHLILDIQNRSLHDRDDARNEYILPAPGDVAGSIMSESTEQDLLLCDKYLKQAFWFLGLDVSMTIENRKAGSGPVCIEENR